MDLVDGLGLGELTAQALVVLGERRHEPRFGNRRVGLAPTLLRLQRRKFGSLALLAPGGEIGGIDALAAQQRPDLAGLGAALSFGQDASPLAGGELPPLCRGGHLRVGRRRDGCRASSRPTGSFRRDIHRHSLVSVHQCPHLISHDPNLPLYSNYTKVGVSAHIGTGGIQTPLPLIEQTVEQDNGRFEFVGGDLQSTDIAAAR